VEAESKTTNKISWANKAKAHKRRKNSIIPNKERAIRQEKSVRKSLDKHKTMCGCELPALF